MNLKVNINKIHSDLSESFESVKVYEKSSIELGEYIELVAVKEGKELNLIVTKRQLENERFDWSYYSNPNVKDFLVERNSSIEGFLKDVNDIFDKNRFDENYLKDINN